MPLRLDSQSPDFERAFKALLATKREVSDDVDVAVRAIIGAVRGEGDAALIRLSAQFDRVDLAAHGLRVTPDEIAAAKTACRAEDVAALRLAHARIKSFHERQIPQDLRFTDPLGVELGWRWTAIQAVGLYVPGGTASYPSSVLMNAVPAKVAAASGSSWRCRRRTAASTRWCWRRPTFPASTRSIVSVGRRRSPRSPLGPKRSHRS